MTWPSDLLISRLSSVADTDYDEPPAGIHVLWERVEEKWREIEAEVCQKLVESMPERIEAVYQAKGGWTKY